MFRTVAAHASMNLALQVASVLLALALGVALSRLLGADGLGVYAFAMSTATLLSTVASLGLGTLVVREVAIGREAGDWPAVVGLVSWGQRATAVAAALVGGITLGVGWWAATPRTLATLTVAMVVLLLMTGTTVRSAALRGLNAVVAASVPLQLVRPAVALAGVVLLSLLGAGLPQLAMAAEAVAWAVAGAVALWLWTRRLPVRPDVVAWTPRRWLLAALPILALDGLLVTMHQCDILLLKWMSTSSSTGIYSVTVQLGRVAALILIVANSVITPRFAALHAAGRIDELQRLVMWSARTVTALTAVLALALVVFGELALSVYSPGFEAGYPALVVLVIGQAVNAMAGSVGFLLIMTGNERDVLVISAGVAVLNLVLNMVLIPGLDMLGAAIASAVAVSAWTLPLVVFVRIRLGINSTALPLRVP